MLRIIISLYAGNEAHEECCSTVDPGVPCLVFAYICAWGCEFNRFLSVLPRIYVQPACKEEEDWINDDDDDAVPFLQSVPWLLLCN